MEADSVSDSLGFSLRVRAVKMAAPQSGTSACARGQLLSSMATAPWQLARVGGSGSSAPEKAGTSTTDAPPPPAQRAALRRGGNCDCDQERPLERLNSREVRLGCGRGARQEPVRGNHRLACGGQSERLDGFLLPQASLIEINLPCTF